jgi:hypothetical protein
LKASTRTPPWNDATTTPTRKLVRLNFIMIL